MKLDKKTVFLFDGTGAALSFLSTAFVLPLFSTYLGLTPETFYLLAVFPFVYLVYSLSCYFLVQETKKWMLSLIIIGNFLYCIVSGLLIVFRSEITKWGVLLLSVEILVILLVILIEIKVYRNNFKPVAN